VRQDRRRGRCATTQLRTKSLNTRLAVTRRHNCYTSKTQSLFSLVDMRRVAERPGRAPTTRAALETQKSTRHHCDIHRPQEVWLPAHKATNRRRITHNHTSGRLARQQPERQYTNEFNKSTIRTSARIFTKVRSEYYVNRVCRPSRRRRLRQRAKRAARAHPRPSARQPGPSPYR
jgi:hypothetical protein